MNIYSGSGFIRKNLIYSGARDLHATRPNQASFTIQPTELLPYKLATFLYLT